MSRVMKMSLRPRAVACLFGMTAALGISGVHAAEVEMSSPAAVPEPLVQPMAPSPASPVAPLTDADRRAVYRGGALHDMGDTELHSYFVFDQLEWQHRAAGGTLNWNGNGWIGGDLDRLWLRTEGSRVGSRLEDAEVQALWGRSITPWWDLVAGVGHDFRPSAAQTWLAFGIQGLALYNFESEVTAFVGQRGQASLRVEGRYDLLITNRRFCSRRSRPICSRRTTRRAGKAPASAIPRWACACATKWIVSSLPISASAGIVPTATARAWSSGRAAGARTCRCWRAFACGFERRGALSLHPFSRPSGVHPCRVV